MSLLYAILSLWLEVADADMSDPLKNATLCRALINLHHTIYSNLARRVPFLTRRNRKATSSLLPDGIPSSLARLALQLPYVASRMLYLL